MKVVMAVHHYPPRYRAGVELISERACHWLISHGHSVELVSVEDIDSDVPLSVRRGNQDGCVVWRLGLSIAGRGGHLGLRFRDDTLRRWFEEYLRRSQPDLFHSQSCYLITASTLEAARNVGIPTVASLHDYWFMCPRMTLLRPNGQRCSGERDAADCAWCLMTERRRYRLLDDVLGRLTRGDAGRSASWPPFARLLDPALLAEVKSRQDYLMNELKSVEAITTSARLVQDLLVSRSFTQERVRVVPYGLDLSGWRGSRRSLSDDALRIGYLGQLAPHKGVHLLIEAFKRLRPRTRVPVLAIFGSAGQGSQYGTQLKKLAAGHPQIHFRGSYDHDILEEILSDIDLLVVPSTWWETGPMVTMEAFAARIPVVASRLPNMQYQIQDGVDGLLFAPGDIEDLVCKLQRLIDEPGLLGRLSNRIRPVRTVDDEMGEILDTYISVAKRSARAIDASTIA